jgi:hypothetical protein
MIYTIFVRFRIRQFNILIQIMILAQILIQILILILFANHLAGNGSSIHIYVANFLNTRNEIGILLLNIRIRIRIRL